MSILRWIACDLTRDSLICLEGSAWGSVDNGERLVQKGRFIRTPSKSSAGAGSEICYNRKHPFSLNPIEPYVKRLRHVGNTSRCFPDSYITIISSYQFPAHTNVRGIIRRIVQESNNQSMALLNNTRSGGNATAIWLPPIYL